MSDVNLQDLEKNMLPVFNSIVIVILMVTMI